MIINSLSWPKKVRLTFVISFLSLMAIFTATSSLLLLRSLKLAEQQDCLRVVKGVLGVLNQTTEDFDLRFIDWSAWDDSYNFVQDQNQEFIETNLVPETLAAMRLNLILYINNSGKIIFGTGFDYKKQQKQPIPTQIQKLISLDNLLLQHPDVESKHFGLLSLPEGIMLITSRPIIPTKGTGKIQGTLIFGRYLDEDGINKIAKATRSSISIFTLVDNQIKPEIKQALEAKKLPDNIVTEIVNQDFISGYTIVNNLYDQPALIVRVNVPREIYKQGLHNLYYLLGCLLILAICFGGLIWYLLERLIILWENTNQAKAVAEEANQAKSIFLTNMSQELRTPLKTIIGYSEMLQEEIEDLGARYLLHDLQKIQASGKHLLGLINEILDLSKLEAGTMELDYQTFEIASLINEIQASIQPLIDKNNNTLRINCQENLGIIESDPIKLRQSLYNLLHNASKFTNQGIITLTVYSKEDKGEKWLYFEVNDTGIGMNSEQQEKLFHAFTQADPSINRQYGGTGLGLAITKKFCEMMGGNIMVKSELNQGSTFTIRLPLQLSKLKDEG